MTSDEIPLGLYRLHWRDGGTSLASIGCKEDGQRWFAPCNWVMVPSFDWKRVDRVTPILLTHESGADNFVEVPAK